jgi:hypothetical protein
MTMDTFVSQSTGWLLEDFNRSDLDSIAAEEIAVEAEPPAEAPDYSLVNTWTDGYLQAGRLEQTSPSEEISRAAFLRSLEDVEARLTASADHASAQVASLMLTALASLGIEKRVADTAGCIRDLLHLIKPALRGSVPTITLHVGDEAPPTVISQNLLNGGTMHLPAAERITISWGLGEAHIDWRATMQAFSAALAPLIWAAALPEENPPIAESK